MIEAFLKYLQYEKRVSRHTTLAYKNDLEQFQSFLQTTFNANNTELADYGMVRSWIISLVESGIGASSVNRKIAALRTYYKYLLRQEVIRKDPMIKIRVLKTKKKLPGFVKESEMIEILDNDAQSGEFSKRKLPEETLFEKLRNQLIL
jgi:integrase/recombinase XerC